MRCMFGGFGGGGRCCAVATFVVVGWSLSGGLFSSLDWESKVKFSLTGARSVGGHKIK